MRERGWRAAPGARAGALLLCALIVPVRLAAQADAPSDPVQVSRTASPLLPPDHWAVEAARRAEALGLAPDFLPAELAVPRAVVAEALRSAAERSGDSPWAPSAAAWYARFLEEFPEAAGDPAAPAVLGGAAELAYLRATGAGVPGFGEFAPDRSGALAAPDRSHAALAVDVAALPARWLVIQAEPRLGPDLSLARWEVSAAAGRWALTAGRGRVGYGTAAGGGVILSGREPLDRVQLATTRPLRLPGVLGLLGPISLHTMLSRLPEERHAREPYFWGASGSLRPHPRFTLSVHRAAMFGGEGYPVTAERLGRMLLGQVKGIGFENQQVSVEARFRMPSERVLPLVAYLEWGAEDAAGSLRDVPGRVAGLYAPTLPGLAGAALGVEYASFAGSCCGNPPWNRHWAFPGSWALDEEPLGHPLGGQGREWLLYAHADLFGARARVDARAFRRDRGAENLYVPGRGGSSTGASAALLWRVARRADVRFQGSMEDGEGWRERSAAVGVRVFFEE